MKFASIVYLLIITFCSTNVTGQDSIIISGTIKDFYTNQVLPFSNISINNTYIGTSANIYGKYTLIVPKQFIPFDLSASFLGYEDTTININQIKNQKCNIFLYPKSIDINEITINSEKNVVFGNKDFQILDYTIYKDKILIISYKKKLSKAIIVMIDFEGRKIAAKPIKDKPIKFYMDCIGDLYLICQSSPYIIHTTNSYLWLQRAYQDKFNKLVKPCVANLNDIYFYKYPGPFDLSLEYYAYNHTNNEFKLFSRIDDNEQQQMFMDDFNHLLMSSGLKILGNKNTYETLKIFRASDLKEVFDHDIMHTPIYVPLFTNKKNNRVYIFDHPNCMIHHYAISGQLIKSVEITYPKQKAHGKSIIYDEITNKYYVISIKNGIASIHYINIDKGIIEYSKKIPYSWIENISIRGDILYFLYRRKDKNSAKFLYFENI